MTRLKYCWIFLIAVPVLSASADTATCIVEIEDVTAAVNSNAAANRTAQFVFELTPKSDMQRGYFQLSKGSYSCALAFFDLDSGTSLSCEREDDQGHTYFQSDRSGISEHAARNNLIFREGDSHFVLNATCE